MENNHKQKNIPEGWKIEKLGYLCSKIQDGTHQTPDYYDKGIPFFSVENVVANDFTNVKYISESAHTENMKSCKPERGDILLTRIGALGVSRLIDWDVNASIYVSLALLKPNSKIIYNQFLYQVTKSGYFLKDLVSRSLTIATPQKINLGDIQDIEIITPLLAEQIRIAKVLTTWNEAINKLGKKIEIKKRVKKGLIRELLTGKTRLPGFSGEWKAVKLGNVCEFQNGFAFKSKLFKNSGEPVIRISNIQKDKISLNNLTFINIKEYKENLENYKANYGDLIIAMSGATTGKIAKIDLKKTFYLNQRVGKFIPIKNILNNYFLYSILSTMVENLLDISAGGAQPNLSTQQIKDIRLKLPDFREQTAIANILSAADEELEGLEKKLGILKNQKQFLLNKLVTGEIRVLEGV